MSEREEALYKILGYLSFMVINAEDRRIISAEIERALALPPEDAPQSAPFTPYRMVRLSADIDEDLYE